MCGALVTKLSVTTYPWRRITTPKQLASVLETIKKIGFEGVGLEYGYLPSAIKLKPELTQPIVEKSGLENGGTFSPGARTRIKWAHDSGTPLIWVSIYSNDTKVALEKLRRFVETSKEFGVTASLHNEVRSAFQTSGDIKRAMKSIEGLTLCLDTAHGSAAGVKIPDTIEEYSDRLTLVHLKDFKGNVPLREVKFTRDFVNVGRGVVDLQGAVDKLKSVGYRGQLMVEVEANEGQKAVEVVKEGYDYAKSLL
jgi:sugar phosphate isomerase/epimerase